MQELYRKLLEFTQEGVHCYTFDEGRILMANPGLVRLLDWDGPPESLIGKRLDEVLAYVQPPGVIRRVLEQTGEIHDYEYHFKTLKGDDRWVLHDSFLITDPSTGERVVQAIVRDITPLKHAERKLAAENERLEHLVAQRTTELARANAALQVQLDEYARVEKALRVSEERFRLAVTNAPIAFFQHDVQLRYTWIHYPQAPFPTGDFIGKTDAELLSPEEGASLTEFKRRVLETGIGGRVTLPLTHGGVACFYDVTVEPLRDPRGAVIGLTCVALDITERKHVEENLRLSNVELEQFAYVASHDLQEPLRVISGFLQLLQHRYAGRLDPDADEYIRFAVDGAGRMRNLIRDLLEYSRVGRRGQPFAAADCNAIVQTVISNLQPAIAEKRGRVTCDPLPVIHGDATELTQLFQNLIANAIKFHGPQPPEVCLTAQRCGNEWTFRVRDNGIGIDPKNFQRVFVIFQRLHTLEEYSGTGIGLALCRKIVERHGGRIWVESSLGHGATFHFTLPAQGEHTP